MSNSIRFGCGFACLILLGGLGELMAHPLLEPPPAKAKTPLPVAPPPRVVTEKQKMERAQIGCQRLADALAAYVNHPKNPGKNFEEKLPSSPTDLLKPPFGAVSFLPNGQADFLDPWGQVYLVELRTKKDGTTYVYFYTRAEDGTPISQFGIDKKSLPPE